ncbi:oligosaccharide flippase family protein [Sphingomonas aerolata]|jgi:O-antigen/teichoic acid export membrane protein|uniref:oligosaccharide flippase family protein n=1 Tax=Sphingomonas aerolata TaxID=185951 RepID=UPI00335B298C
MSVKKSIGWMAGAQFVYFALQLVSSVVLARLLTPYEVGIFAVAFAASGLISVIQSLGLNNYLIRERDLTAALSATIFSINFAVAFFLTLVIAAFGMVSASIFDEPAVRSVLLFLAVIPLIAALGFMPLAMLERDGNFKKVSLVKMLGTASGTIATLGFAFTGHSYMSFAYGQIIAASVSAAMAIAFAPHHASFRMGLENWRAVQRFSVNVLATTGVGRIAARLQDMTMGRLLGIEALGLFSRSGNIFSMLWDSVFLVICRIMFVDFAAGARAGVPIGPRYQHALGLFTALMWPAFLGLGVLSGPFVLLIYGAKWVSITMCLSILCMIGIFYTAIAMAWDLFIIADETGRQARFEIIRSIIGLAVFAGACFISIEAAATARLIDAIFAFFLYMPHILRITDSRLGDIMRIYGRSAVLAVAAVAPAFCVMTWYGWSPAAPLLVVIIAVVAGVGLWAMTLRLLSHPLFFEARSLLMRRYKAIKLI